MRTGGNLRRRCCVCMRVCFNVIWISCTGASFNEDTVFVFFCVCQMLNQDFTCMYCILFVCLNCFYICIPQFQLSMLLVSKFSSDKDIYALTPKYTCICKHTDTRTHKNT